MEHGKGLYASLRTIGLNLLGLDTNGKPKKKAAEPAKELHSLNVECPFMGNSSPNLRATHSGKASGGP